MLSKSFFRKVYPFFVSKDGGVFFFFLFNIVNSLLIVAAFLLNFQRLDFIVLALYIGFTFLMFIHHPYAQKQTREAHPISLRKDLVLIFKPVMFVVGYVAFLFLCAQVANHSLAQVESNEEIYDLYYAFCFVFFVLGFAYYIIKKITSMQILRRKKSIAIFKLRYYFKRYVDSKRKKDLLPFFIGFLTYVRSSRILTWLVFGLSIRYDNGFTAILFLHIYQFEDRYNDNLLGRARRINNDNGHHIREYNNSNPFATPQEPEPFQQPDRVLFPGSLMWWGSMSATPFLGRFARVLIRTVPRNPGGPNANNGSPNAND